MTQKHAVPLELKTLLQSYHFELRQADSVEHWLVMYFLKYVFWIIFNPQKATDFSFNYHYDWG